jgi:hypothetical protein
VLAATFRSLCICAAMVAGGLLAFWLPPLLHLLGRTPEGAHWARMDVKNLHKALKCAAHPTRMHDALQREHMFGPHIHSALRVARVLINNSEGPA